MVFIIIYRNSNYTYGSHLSIVRSKADFLRARDSQFVNLDRRIEEITEDLQNFFASNLEVYPRIMQLRHVIT